MDLFVIWSLKAPLEVVKDTYPICSVNANVSWCILENWKDSRLARSMKSLLGNALEKNKCLIESF